MSHSDAKRGQRTSPNGEPTGVINITKAFFKDFTEDDVPGMAAAVAYHMIFSLPALMIVVVALAAVLTQFTGIDLANQLKDAIATNAPQNSEEILTELVDNALLRVDGGTASFGLLVSVLVALWAGSNGVGAMVKSFNRAYDVTEVRAFPAQKGLAIGLTILLGLIGNLAIALWVFGGQIGQWIAGWFGLGDIFDWIWGISRWPLSVLIIIMMTMLLYWAAPAVSLTFRSVWPGALAATVLWFILLSGFSIYLKFADPGSAYGALSSLLIMLLLLYFTAIIFITGAEINAMIRQRALAAERGPVEETEIGEWPKFSLAELGLGVATAIGLVLIGTLGRRGGGN